MTVYFGPFSSISRLPEEAPSEPMTSSLSRSSQGLVAVDRSEAREDFHPGPDYFSRSGESFGRDSIDLIIGPIRMRLLGLAGDQAEALGERFRPFTAEGRGEPDLSITLRPAGVPGFLTMRGEGPSETYRLESRVDGGGAHLWSYELAGRLESGTGRAMLDLVEPQGELFERGLENFLRVMTASFIVTRGGFLLHGSGVVRKGRAYIFFGPSGAGKTTITALSPADTILSDDLTLVVRREDGGYGAAG